MKYYMPSILPETINFQNKTVLVLGLGKYGGGVGAARYFATKGANVTVADLKSRNELEASLEKIKDLDISYHFGSHNTINFLAFDLICVNPAVPPFIPKLVEARNHGIPITTEMNVFFAHCRAKIVGITGSNGKSTTTALVYHLLQGLNKKIWLGGNIGNSLLPFVDEISKDDIVILELSSFQLEELHNLRMSPTVSILTNLSPNHLDRHLSYDAYVAAKMSAFCYQKPRHISILNYDDIRSRSIMSSTSGRISLYSITKKVSPGAFLENDKFCVDLGKGKIEIAPIKSLKLIGNFNRSNALAAILAASVLKTPPDQIRRLLPQFNKLKHRLELVNNVLGIEFYNDSISTSPESTIAGISAFAKPIWLILGGSDKGLDYNQLGRFILQSDVVGVLGIGDIGRDILELIAKMNNAKLQPKKLELIHTKTMKNSFIFLADNAKPGQVVLLSPGTASFDQFTNFEHRGEVFSKLASDFQPFRNPNRIASKRIGTHSISKPIPKEIATKKLHRKEKPFSDTDIRKIAKSVAETHINNSEDTMPAFEDFSKSKSDTTFIPPADYSDFNTKTASVSSDEFSDNFEKDLNQKISTAFYKQNPDPIDPEEIISVSGLFDKVDIDEHVADTKQNAENSEFSLPDDVNSLFSGSQDILQPLDTGIMNLIDVDEDEELEK